MLSYKRLSFWLIVASIILTAAMMTPNIWIIPAILWNTAMLFVARKFAQLDGAGRS